MSILSVDAWRLMWLCCTMRGIRSITLLISPICALAKAGSDHRQASFPIERGGQGADCRADCGGARRLSGGSSGCGAAGGWQGAVRDGGGEVHALDRTWAMHAAPVECGAEHRATRCGGDESP